MPKDVTLPIVMVGPGAGVAPFRAFIQERRRLRATLDQSVGPAWLFFGCRRSNEDYLYSDELESAVKDGTLDKLEVAFSREIPGSKVYVQHKLLDAVSQKSFCVCVEFACADSFLCRSFVPE